MTRTIAALVLVVALAGFAVTGLAGSPEPFEALGLVRFESGIRAPAFTRPALDGKPVSVSSEAGAATLLVFWTTW